MTKTGYRLLEHTADMGIEATAKTFDRLFVEAARGLLEILGSPRAPEGDRGREEERIVQVEGIDRGDLLVRWLGEILYLAESGRLCPTAFDVETADDRLFRARLRVIRRDEVRQPLEREVKAITYHRLFVEREEDGGWRARVYVDL